MYLYFGLLGMINFPILFSTDFDSTSPGCFLMIDSKLSTMLTLSSDFNIDVNNVTREENFFLAKAALILDCIFFIFLISPLLLNWNFERSLGRVGRCFTLLSDGFE